MRHRLQRWLLSFLRWLQPKPDLRPLVKALADRTAELESREDDGRREFMERVSELAEARAMAGSGPWSVGPEALRKTDELIRYAHESYSRPVNLRETTPPLSAGAFGDIDLALQNVEWRREVNFSWLEFSRWGIQQIILVSRMYYIKNPIIRRLIDVCAAYVFARGVEVSSPDEDVNKIIDQFLQDNAKVLGHRALMRSERRKDYDGNLFFVSFDDAVSDGTSKIRTIDATEIDEIETDPEDTDTEWYFKRVSSQRIFDPATGGTTVKTVKAWYPAFGYQPGEKPATIGGDPVMWNSPVYHVSCGQVGKWLFGCPRMYPALDWAREARRYLESCASVKAAMAQIARQITTKGGQQAIEGIKAQMGTTVGPAGQLWDKNPPAVAGATQVFGPGTKMDLIKSRGAGDNPEEVRRYLQMCVMVAGVPETFLGDVSTGNLATATSLDRPTETIMLEKQEEWREDLVAIVMHNLEVSKKAPGGKLRESLTKRWLDPGEVTIREAMRVRTPDGTRMQYAKLEMRESGGKMVLHEAGRPVPSTEILVRVTFPRSVKAICRSS